MGKKDPRVDAYIRAAAPFARPVLQHLRALVHKACPGVTENIKWSMPFFEWQGPVCHMAAFKGHCAFGFWRASLMKDAAVLLASRQEGMGSLGRIGSLADLPADRVLMDYIREAAGLNELGVKPARKKKPAVQEPLEVPEYFSRAVKKNKAAWKTFEAFPYSHRKEYLQWVGEAKTEPTREKRLQQAIEWMAEGRDRNWKYRK
jgi:hypothetical protein